MERVLWGSAPQVPPACDSHQELQEAPQRVKALWNADPWQSSVAQKAQRSHKQTVGPLGPLGEDAPCQKAVEFQVNSCVNSRQE